MCATLHYYWECPVLVNRSDELTACPRHDHQQTSLLCFYGEVAEQRNTRVSREHGWIFLTQDRYSTKKQRLATNWAEATAYM